MNKKHLERLANKIVKAEKTIQANQNESEVRKAKQEILLLSEQISSLEDLFALDEILIEKLKK